MSKQKRDGPPFQCAATVVPLCIDQSHCAVILKAGFCEERVISESNYHRERDRNLSLFESLFEISLSIEISLHWGSRDESVVPKWKFWFWSTSLSINLFISAQAINLYKGHYLFLSFLALSPLFFLLDFFLSFFVAPRALLQSWWDEMHR